MNAIEEMVKATVGYHEAFGQDWVSFGLVVEVKEDGRPHGTNGYLFKSDGDFEAISVKPRLLRPSIAAYLQEVYGDTQPPIKMLLQFDRASGRFNVQFEDKDESRWQVRPADIHGYIEELRPKFDQ
ncbi:MULTISPECIES: hypothetical protein [Rhodobacterales]|uniref:Uncharacterized protein n=1 Tax=Tritonibacter mobilis F1926 TaxID=1265309 RepID=A0A1B1A8Q2_9RHOB|nr:MULTISPECIES: hypothetical protein [Rhodobacterales]ANP42952.1 hypothetical protein K529_019505 [Tritonibacter mobilis F1926]MCG7626737.1 hypothetical protein [Epibacterium sp. MM17-32]PXW78797.1 hypothetical protein BZA02_10915 [Ruegeria sp. P4]